MADMATRHHGEPGTGAQRTPASDDPERRPAREVTALLQRDYGTLPDKVEAVDEYGDE